MTEPQTISCATTVTGVYNVYPWRAEAYCLLSQKSKGGNCGPRAATTAAVLSIVQDEIEQAWDEAHLCQTDKAWDAIHSCLTDGTLRNGQGPLGWCILGGEQLHQDSSYIISLLTPEQVQQVAEALRPLTKEWMRTRYFKIDPVDLWKCGHAQR